MNFTKNDDIAAIATAHGAGAICIIRLSGATALKTALKLTKTAALEPRYASLRKIYSFEGEFLDEAIMIYFKAPASFTGEDVVEIQTHGGFVVADTILGELVKAGARLACPGEFSKRAFLNGKLDLSKAEAIQGLINARSESAAKILARQMRGDLGEYVNDMRSQIVRTLAFVETSIDYAEDDLPRDLLENIRQMLSKNIEKLDRIVDISRSRRGLIEGFKIAIVGKPNVGKSSILNALLSFERAIISDEAGTTRDRIEENLKVGTHLVRFIDTAGIRANAGKIEQIGIERAFDAIKEAEIILAVFDGSQASDEQDREILEILREREDQEAPKKIFYVLNKSDLEPKFDIKIDGAIKISAKSGVERILEILRDYLDAQDVNELVLSSNRQISQCEVASAALKRAQSFLSEGELEIFAYELNSAIAAIAAITWPFERDEILDEMFSSFCLGK